MKAKNCYHTILISYIYILQQRLFNNGSKILLPVVEELKEWNESSFLTSHGRLFHNLAPL